MNRLYFAFLMIFLVIFISFMPGPVNAQGTISNPIVESGADPWVVRHDRLYYYCYSRNNAVWIRSSENLEDIGFGDEACVWAPPEGKPYSKELWAPELHRINGKWYIYVAADNGNNNLHRMYVLEREDPDPQGLFTFKGKIAAETDRWAIDGTVLQLNGRLYFIWSGWEGVVNVQQNLYIAEMAGSTEIKGDRVLISKPEYQWELNGKPYINEGPEVLKNGDRVFIIYSASGSWTDDYCLGQLNLEGDDPLAPGAWVKKPVPVFTKTSSVFGPGHASFVKSADGKEDWIVYHSAKRSGAGWDRQVNIQPFTWNKDGSPNFGKPVPAGFEIPAPSNSRF